MSLNKKWSFLIYLYKTNNSKAAFHIIYMTNHYRCILDKHNIKHQYKYINALYNLHKAKSKRLCTLLIMY